MQSFTRFAAAAVLAAAMAFGATAVSAAEAPLPLEPKVSLTGAVAPLAPQLIAKAPEAEKIVVARRGRWVGPAIVGGIVAGALIAGAARSHAHERSYYYRDHGPSRCERWHYKCDRGHGWACRNFYRYCD
ncbi:MAG: hypothetical protein NW205_13230 [Hyphomicrobiaceae bacterium]|nr:hypothetical protein [Hyphomicrobiaceae bacterium]